jgi:hypothetical protein
VRDAASRFDEFARWAVGKTVGEVASTWSNKLASAQFLKAAEGVGLIPESLLTAQLLSNPAKAMPLARVRGIGTDLSDEQWRQAHAIAFQAAKARQAENAAAASQSVPNLGQAAPQPQQAQPTASRATTDVVCAVVLNTPDGFLAVRERPGTQFRMTDKLRPGACHRSFLLQLRVLRARRGASI